MRSQESSSSPPFLELQRQIPATASPYSLATMIWQNLCFTEPEIQNGIEWHHLYCCPQSLFLCSLHPYMATFQSYNFVTWSSDFALPPSHRVSTLWTTTPSYPPSNHHTITPRLCSSGQHVIKGEFCQLKDEWVVSAQQLEHEIFGTTGSTRYDQGDRSYHRSTGSTDSTWYS